MNEVMSKRKWFLLLCIEISYILIGACFFFHIESKEELLRREADKKERKEIEALLIAHYRPGNDTQEIIFRKLTDYCGKPMHHNMSGHEPPYRWDFYHSLFFVITVVTTIGYGNLAPTTMFGRIVMIFYSVVGIPINGIVMVTLGNFFGKKFTKLYERWKNNKIHDIAGNFGLVGQVALYLIPGFTFFIFLPSVIIMIFEGWDYDVAVYYSYVTLTTIGFGDYVAGVEDHNFGEVLFTIYQVFLLIWIIIGLGYIVMVLGFISRGMRSKKVQEIEHILAENLLRTPMKFRALKSLVYEILLMRVKPVYKKGSIAPIVSERRAYSLPDLTLIYDDLGSKRCRKRAMSETNPKDLPAMHRVHSDSNLHLIDKELTFTSKKEQQQHELLRKMSHFVNSYEARLNQICGFDGFSEDEILESEKYQSQWTIGSASVPKNQSTPSVRTRASSISKIQYAESNDVTWYGQSAALKEQQMREQIKHGRARSRTLPVQQQPLLKLPQGGFFNRLRKRFVTTDSSKEKDIEKQDVVTPQVTIPQIKITRRRAQSESQNAGTAYDTSEEEREWKQLASLLIKLANHEEEPKRKVGSVTPPDYSTPRARRLAILPIPSRRGSLAPPSPSHFQGRRFSLRPPDDVSPSGNSPVIERPRRFSLRPVVNIASSPSPVQRHRLKNKDNVIIENERIN